uniref:Putative secreted peptide n=1 Tax=Anopheles braziliensis TaxID=58242 RepID=A0A2M3ZSU9_9DIPT
MTFGIVGPHHLVSLLLSQVLALPERSLIDKNRYAPFASTSSPYTQSSGVTVNVNLPFFSSSTVPSNLLYDNL